ncbi:MAG: transporter substrate-binding domain-containing protein [Oscillibacter sp.]|nr:transporter substrate-binding domain-containing protein [Oscillibacter sp.]
MKKKLLALALALTMVLALTACGGDSKNSGDGTLPADTSGNAEQPEDASGGGQAASGSDIAYIQDKGTLIVGMTDFAPMDYKEDGSDEWIGFDADMAKAFGESLGVAVEFLELADWDAKSMELDTKAIDVVWNGMTLTDDVKALMGTSNPYCLNGQVVVVAADKASQYQTVESLGELSFAVENGSAGAEQLDALNISYTAMQNQAAALMEVASGASDAAVIDRLMAGAMIGEGTSYPDLTYTVQLNDEEYGVGFRKGSDLVDAFNTWWKDMYAEGMVLEVAEIYGVQEAVKGVVEG